VHSMCAIFQCFAGYYTESKAEGVMEGFKKLVPKKCKVLRDGNIVILDAAELVPGAQHSARLALARIGWQAGGRRQQGCLRSSKLGTCGGRVDRDCGSGSVLEFAIDLASPCLSMQVMWLTWVMVTRCQPTSES
jgi:hypothetical protein